jgi:S-adenosylmethionine synthetase
LAGCAEVEVSYAIGWPEPLAVSVETLGTASVSREALQHVLQLFDFRPSAIIRKLGLRTPFYAPLAAYGHMGRTDGDYPWERLDMVSQIRGSGFGL